MRSTLVRKFGSNQSMRVTFVLAVGFAYIAAFFPVFYLAGGVAAALMVFPMAAAGLFTGLRGALVAAVLSAPVNVALFNLVGEMGIEMVARNWPGLSTGILVGLGAAVLKSLETRTRKQADELSEALSRTSEANRELTDAYERISQTQVEIIKNNQQLDAAVRQTDSANRELNALNQTVRETLDLLFSNISEVTEAAEARLSSYPEGPTRDAFASFLWNLDGIVRGRRS